MAVVALIVAMLAQLKTRDQWLAMFGGRVTHHYVVLDDSYSMSRPRRRRVGHGCRQAGDRPPSSAGPTQEDSPQKLTLIRYSQARGSAGSRSANGDRASIADFNAEPIDSNFDVTLERKLRTFEPTQLALGPRDALAVLKQLLGQAERRNEHRLSAVRLSRRRTGAARPSCARRCGN